VQASSSSVTTASIFATLQRIVANSKVTDRGDVDETNKPGTRDGVGVDADATTPRGKARLRGAGQPATAPGAEKMTADGLIWSPPTTSCVPRSTPSPRARRLRRPGAAVSASNAEGGNEAATVGKARPAGSASAVAADMKKDSKLVAGDSEGIITPSVVNVIRNPTAGASAQPQSDVASSSLREHHVIRSPSSPRQTEEGLKTQALKAGGGAESGPGVWVEHHNQPRYGLHLMSSSSLCLNLFPLICVSAHRTSVS
jgi:hypothetical protein